MESTIDIQTCYILNWSNIAFSFRKTPFNALGVPLGIVIMLRIESRVSCAIDDIFFDVTMSAPWRRPDARVSVPDLHSDNMVGLLGGCGGADKDVPQGVREVVGKQRYQVACNRVFEYVHRKEIKGVKDKGIMGGAELDTILHPNEYFKRSFTLKHLGDAEVVERLKAEKAKTESESEGNEW